MKNKGLQVITAEQVLHTYEVMYEVDSAKYNDGYVVDLDDTKNFDTRVSFMYEVFDSKAEDNSYIFMAPNRMAAKRNLEGFLHTVPNHVDVADFSLNIVAAIIGGVPIALKKECIAHGTEYPREVVNEQER